MNPRQQVWFGLEVVFVAVGFNVLCAFLLFVQPMSGWFGEDEGRLLEDLNRVLLIKWPMVFVALIVLFIIGVLMAHRILGPIKGFNDVLTAWRSGRRGSRVRFRRYDYTLPMMQPLNDFLTDQEILVTRAEKLAKSVTGGAPDRKEAEELLVLLQPQEGKR